LTATERSTQRTAKALSRIDFEIGRVSPLTAILDLRHR
jgi:hypothetical protein